MQSVLNSRDDSEVDWDLPGSSFYRDDLVCVLSRCHLPANPIAFSGLDKKQSSKLTLFDQILKRLPWQPRDDFSPLPKQPWVQYTVGFVWSEGFCLSWVKDGG